MWTWETYQAQKAAWRQRAKATAADFTAALEEWEKNLPAEAKEAGAEKAPGAGAGGANRIMSAYKAAPGEHQLLSGPGHNGDVDDEP